MHYTGLPVGTVENYVPECWRTELPRVLSACRGREGKSLSDTHPSVGLEEG